MAPGRVLVVVWAFLGGAVTVVACGSPGDSGPALSVVREAVVVGADGAIVTEPNPPRTYNVWGKSSNSDLGSCHTRASDALLLGNHGIFVCTAAENGAN